MSTYVFSAMDVAGVKSRGEVDGDSKQAVAAQLRTQGLIVLDLADKGIASRSINMEMFERIKLGELAIMTRQLATMVSSGMTILRALYVLEAQTENKKLLEVLLKVRKDVEAGLPLSDAFGRHPKVFNELYVAMTRSGETGGMLESALLRVADQLEKEESLRRQVKSAMVYPGVVMSFAGIVLIALVAFIVPVFVKVFKQFGSDLPAITQFTVGISHLVTHQWYLLIGAVVLIVVAFRKWKGSATGHAQWDAMKLRIPFKIGDIVQKVALARWSRTLSALVSAGVPLLQALEITGKTAGNTVIDKAMQDVIASVKRGGTISAPLRASPVFPAMVGHMVGVGEQTGALDTMLAKVADFYEDQVASAVKALTSILEPVMIVVVGGIVGFIVIAMYMPLFKVYDAIK
ncbi:MAG: type II secretion system F family protein [Actinobacteria bacterium]|nr:type II secretion system F family protein [Actinomycetota bacterium]